jgi:hypothetical protein
MNKKLYKVLLTIILILTTVYNHNRLVLAQTKRPFRGTITAIPEVYADYKIKNIPDSLKLKIVMLRRVLPDSISYFIDPQAEKVVEKTWGSKTQQGDIYLDFKNNIFRAIGQKTNYVLTLNDRNQNPNNWIFKPDEQYTQISGQQSSLFKILKNGTQTGSCWMADTLVVPDFLPATTASFDNGRGTITLPLLRYLFANTPAGKRFYSYLALYQPGGQIVTTIKYDFRPDDLPEDALKAP